MQFFQNFFADILDSECLAASGIVRDWEVGHDDERSGWEVGLEVRGDVRGQQVGYIREKKIVMGEVPLERVAH